MMEQAPLTRLVERQAVNLLVVSSMGTTMHSTNFPPATREVGMPVSVPPATRCPGACPEATGATAAEPLMHCSDPGTGCLAQSTIQLLNELLMEGLNPPRQLRTRLAQELDAPRRRLTSL